MSITAVIPSIVILTLRSLVKYPTDIKFFKDYHTILDEGVKAANGSRLEVLGKGSVELACGLVLHKCCYIPIISKNLISVGYLTSDLKVRITMEGITAVIDKLPKGCPVNNITVYQYGKLYIMSSSDGKPKVAPVSRMSFIRGKYNNNNLNNKSLNPMSFNRLALGSQVKSNLLQNILTVLSITRTR